MHIGVKQYPIRVAEPKPAPRVAPVPAEKEIEREPVLIPAPVRRS